MAQRSTKEDMSKRNEVAAELANEVLVKQGMSFAEGKKVFARAWTICNRGDGSKLSKADAIKAFQKKTEKKAEKAAA